MNLNAHAIRRLRCRPHALPAFLGALLLAACFVHAGDTGALITARCVGCHEMDKVCLVQSDDAQWWKATVLRMVEYRSDMLSAEEVPAVSAFLADPGKRVSVCVPK